MPEPLKVCYFVNSGSEANELALLMARLYTGNHEIVALRNAYHGGSNSTMGLTAHSTWKFSSCRTGSQSPILVLISDYIFCSFPRVQILLKALECTTLSAQIATAGFSATMILMPVSSMPTMSRI